MRAPNRSHRPGSRCATTASFGTERRRGVRVAVHGVATGADAAGATRQNIRLGGEPWPGPPRSRRIGLHPPGLLSAVNSHLGDRTFIGSSGTGTASDRTEPLSFLCRRLADAPLDYATAVHPCGDSCTGRVQHVAARSRPRPSRPNADDVLSGRVGPGRPHAACPAGDQSSDATLGPGSTTGSVRRSPCPSAQGSIGVAP